MTTGAPPEKISPDEQKISAIESELDNYWKIGETDARWLIEKAREAARRLAPRVGDEATTKPKEK